MNAIQVVFRPFLYTPRSGSKIVAMSKSATPFVATLKGKAHGSHVLSGPWVELVVRDEGRGDERYGWVATAKALLPLLDAPVVAVDECGKLVLYFKQDMSFCPYGSQESLSGQMANKALAGLSGYADEQTNIVCSLVQAIAPIVKGEIADQSSALQD